MVETLEQFIIRRRGELDGEASALHAQLRVIDAERERIDKVAMMFAAETGDSESEAEIFAQPVARLVRDRSSKRASEATIKTMVLESLSQAPDGLTALVILERINQQIDIPYPRTSLSPQLSRLKAEGKIHRDGHTWLLGGGQDVGEEDDDPLGSDLGTSGQDQYAERHGELETAGQEPSEELPADQEGIFE